MTLCLAEEEISLPELLFNTLKLTIMEKYLWKDYKGDTTSQLYHKVSRGVLAAINDVRFGIAKSDYMDWAFEMGFSRSTANSYWSTAHRLVNAAPDNVRFYAD